MSLPSFSYLAPTSLDEALAAKARLGEAGRWLAGGTDLVVRAKQGLAPCRTVISLRHLARELSGLRPEDHELVIGAMTPLKEAGQHPLVREHLPGLAEALAAIGAETLQQRVGTVGGNLAADTRCVYYNQSPFWRTGMAPCFKLGGEVCHPGGAAAERCRSVCQSDGAVMLTALEAEVELAGPEGTRRLGLEEFYTGKGEAPLALEPHELITAVRVPLRSGEGSAYHKLAWRGAIDYPLVSAAAVVALEAGRVSRVRVVLGAVFAAPLMLKDAVAPMLGAEPEPEAIRAAARRAGSHAEPFIIDNLAAPTAWRRQMVPVVVERALSRAVARAREASGA